MDSLQAVLLGAVEGLTEFLPVSSTGHLILASHLLGVEGEAVKTFEVVIQAGALGAVVGLYRTRMRSMWRGCLGVDAAGRKLLTNLVISFLPAALVGLLLHRVIKRWLFSLWPVVAALALGGVLMIGVDAWLQRRPPPAPRSLDSLTPREAFLIGCAQCVALWPGSSRAMVTMVAGLLLGLPATIAAEYSFLLALPTLGAATLFDGMISWGVLGQEMSLLAVLCGFLAAAGVAAAAIRSFIAYLARQGLAPFGWYRVGVAALIWWLVPYP
ncbi:MAG: undecaprenyl-diphosphate phosphatase [Candidatus Omnitrophica bacterium]|nr:undecaprenyl-diphosphate phosphatase [Candidatus Omnitrophota bacterium]